MSKQFIKDALGWGLGLWLIGYVLSIILFAFVPANLLGWAITPIGTAITLWVLYEKISGNDLVYYIKVGAIWALTAIVFDYLFIVQAFHPADGYYKLDVYLYYALTILLPIIVGWHKGRMNLKTNN